MITFVTALALVGGVCIGVTAASSRVPRLRTLPAVSAATTAVIGAAALWALSSHGLLDAIVLAVATVMSGVIYGAVCWRREWPDAPFSFGRLIILDLAHPGAVSRAYAEAGQESFRKTDVPQLQRD